MRARSRVGVVIGLVALALTGCQQARDLGDQGLEGTVITFSVNVDASEAPAIQELLSRFQKRTRAKVNVEQHSRFRAPVGAKVNLVTDISADELVDRLTRDKSTGKPTIHLVAQDNVALAPLVDGELVQDLEGLFAEPTEAIANLHPALGAQASYVRPFRPNVRLTYARKGDLSEVGMPPPRTAEELVRVARALKTAGRPKLTLSLARGEPAAVTVCELIVSHGGNPLIANDAGSVAAFTFLQRLRREGLISPASFHAKWDTEVENLLSGESSMAENWSFTSAQLAKHGRLGEFEVYEGWNGPDLRRVIGGDVLAIPANVKGKELEAAVELAEFLMSRESQELLVRRNSWPSFRDDVGYGDLPANQRPTFEAIQRALERGWYRPPVAYWPEVSEQLNRAVNAILWEDRPVQPVLDEVHAEIRAAAKQRGVRYP